MSPIRILYFCPQAHALTALVRELAAAGHTGIIEGDILTVNVAGQTLRVSQEVHPEGIRRRLDSEYVAFLLIDLRPLRGPSSFEDRRQAAHALIQSLDAVPDIDLRFGFHRIGLLVSDGDHAALEPALLRFGAQGIRIAWRARLYDPKFMYRVLDEIVRTVHGRRVGKKALCLSGGGTTGMYFELGVLKCLQDCLPEGALNSMDMYFGISAGAVIASFLAVGFSVDEVMTAIAREPGGRMPIADMRLVRAGNYDFGLATRRAVRAARNGTVTMGKILRRKESPSLSGFAAEYRDMWAPPFTAAELERYLREAFELPGASNRFEQLDRELFIGVTDQDTRRHVLFGAPGSPEATISKAVQASVSFNPVFQAVRIGDRVYEDGAVTKTSNFGTAIERGATFVIIVDPFVPQVSHEPGAHLDRGLFFHIDQNVRTMSFSRFRSARNAILRRHPEIDAYTFLPSNRQRGLLADNPMDHRSYQAIWRGAYLSTLARIERCRPKLEGDLGAHGLTLDPEPAQVVARQLEAVETPTLADFYPGRVVRVARPVLTAARQHQKQLAAGDA